ncbi:hypothetical protein GGQ99_004776 [Aminobacter niigataensis]|uniref:Uncharacterized protein n=1 Tax=Aminobacter niigataensis TaxID=83265 RepID=A0ABR6L862_9HYPH|nr:hypothetical protein [Aminobacter niigataensis]MBB4652992.1 hypothetical protein [Aminobacter niigataensis]
MTAMPMSGALALVSGTLQDGTTPCLMFSGTQFGVDLLGWR